MLGLFRDLIDSDDDDNDDDDLSVEKSFLRPMESPSPGGSSTVGSAISNDGRFSLHSPFLVSICFCLAKFRVYN